MLKATVSALTYSLVRQICERENIPFSPPYGDINRFVEVQLAQMTSVLKYPMKVATLQIALWGFRFGGKLFHRNLQEDRRRQIEAWRRSRLSMQKDFIFFYESLISLAFYARPIPTTAIDECAKARSDLQAAAERKGPPDGPTL